MSISDHVRVEVTVSCPGWETACPQAAAVVADTARRTEHELAGDAGATVIIGITLADDAELRQLNRDYRGQDKPTNVLSFAAMTLDDPLPAGAPFLLGDVVLALETICREAAEQGKTVTDHLRHLVVHGVLHLYGQDHEDSTEAMVMEMTEISILARLGVSDPYADTM